MAGPGDLSASGHSKMRRALVAGEEGSLTGVDGLSQKFLEVRGDDTELLDH